MKKTLTASRLGALLLTASACGGSGGRQHRRRQQHPERPGREGLEVDLRLDHEGQKAATGSTQFFAMSQKDADCIGNGLVDKIGIKQLQKYKLLDEN